MSVTVAGGVHSPRLHTVLYSLLLVATPFILLQNFLVEQISALSSAAIAIDSFSIPVMPLLVVMPALGIVLVFRRQITRVRLLGIGIVAFMLLISNQVTDFYFDHNFYDLQQNWHYFAYGIFAWMLYRDLMPRKVPAAKVMLITFLAALGLSTFDEIFQMQLSSRVFDLCDIGKDLWGALMGIVLIYFFTTDSKTLAGEWKQIRQRHLRDYFRRRAGLLLLMFVFALLLLSVSSLLTEREYSGYVAGFTLGGFAIFLLLLHLSRLRLVKFALAATLVGGLLAQTYLFATHDTTARVQLGKNLTVYKGIPIPFFDLLIYPGGGFRLVDKKRFFNLRDQNFLLNQNPDIILLATGKSGVGGLGFPTTEPVQFIYNENTQRGVQVIRLENQRADEVFNRLKSEGKQVLLVVHHEC